MTPFSPFGIECKNLIAKNFWKCIFRASRRCVFIFLYSIMGGDPHHNFKKFCGLCYNIQSNPYTKSKVGLFVTINIFLNVICLLNLTPKHLDKFRLRQKSIPSGNYMFRVRKISRIMCQIYSKLKIKTPERRLVFLF